MSAFALCWQRDGGPIPSETIGAIRRRIADRAGTPVRERSGADWIAWFVPSEWAPGAEDALPLAIGGWTGTGSLRLDDRASLAARVRDRVGAGDIDDASLAWRSFAAWGEQAPRHWLGDYALAVIAPERDRIVLTRGTLGVLHCFHGSVGALVVVADDPSTVAAVPGIDAAIDERAVAEYLGAGALITPTITFRTGVRRVPAAHTLVIHRDGHERLTRHWELPVPAEREVARPGDVVDEFREVVGRAVSDRLRGPRAALLLSGGLDSPTLALAVGRSAPAVRVDALTLSWRGLLANDEEAEWAALAARVAGMRHEVMEVGADGGVSDASMFLAPEPSTDPEPQVWRATAARLAAIAPVALLGEDLDMLLFPTTLVDQVRTLGLVATLRRWREYRVATGVRPWAGFRRSIGALERVRDRRASRPPRWVERSLLRRHPLPPALPARVHRTRPLAARALAQPIWENSLWEDAPAMTGASVQVLLPFMDPRVIAFLFSLPSVPWAQRKHLVRTSLRGIMPDDLVDRPKTPLRGYDAARVGQWQRLGAIADPPAMIAEWVDLDRWRATLARGGPDEVFAAWRVLELGRWLAGPPEQGT